MTWREATICLLAVVSALASGESARAQAPAAGEVYLVAYVDILPASRTTMAAALKQYREATGRESGDTRLDTLEQVGRPGHFVVIERWKDQATLDAHRLTAHAKAFRDAMQPIRVSGYDERPYKVLSTTPAAQTGNGSGRTVYVVSHVDIGGGGGQADAPGMLRRLAEASRQEQGALRFDVVQHAMRANHFTVIEVWRDQSALDTHVAAPHTRAYRDTLQPISGSPVDERVFAAVE
jgi:quinol monooxygenase YgiN